MDTTKELLEDVAGYYTRKGIICELKDENMLYVRFEDSRLENLAYVPIMIVVDAASLQCNFYCFSLYQVPEAQKTAAAVLLNTMNNADMVFARYSMDDDNEIKASLGTMIIPDNHVNSLLISGLIGRMAKDVDNVYPVIKSYFEG